MAELCFVAVRTKSAICCHSASLGNCSATSKTMMRTQEYPSHVPNSVNQIYIWNLHEVNRLINWILITLVYHTGYVTSNGRVTEWWTENNVEGNSWQSEGTWVR